MATDAKALDHTNEVPHERGRLWTSTGDQETCWMRERACLPWAGGTHLRAHADDDRVDGSDGVRATFPSQEVGGYTGKKFW